MSNSASVLVTGSTGYIGGLLVPELLRNGYRVRVLARDPVRLQPRGWLQQVEVVQGDVLNPASLAGALSGINVAYYLVHSMLDGKGFERRDLNAAEGFGRAAASAGVARIIYLGGLGDPNANLSSHLRSRQDTGKALSLGGVPVTEFRAAVVVGAGSASFEMIRYLTERVPVMICPSWVYTRVQPIAIEDVLAYLSSAPAIASSAGRIIEIGGADVLTYGDLMLGYARARGLHRRLLPVPVLTPRLSSHWVGLVTPLPASIARPLVDGLRSEVVVRDAAAPWRCSPRYGHSATRRPCRRRWHRWTRGSSRPLDTKPSQNLGSLRPKPYGRTSKAFFPSDANRSLTRRRKGCLRSSPGSVAATAGCMPIGSGCCALGWTASSVDRVRAGGAIRKRHTWVT